MSKEVQITMRFKECFYCERVMVPKALQRLSIFPNTHPIDQQARHHGWVFEYADVPGEEDEAACEECVKAGRITFTCVICGNARKSDLLHDTNYDQPECTVCYETMTAKAWEEWHEKQREDNRWYYSS